MADNLISPYYKFNPEDNYVNPDEAKRKTTLAEQMLFGRMQQPVHHWTQGVSNMVNALLGGRMLNQLNQRQRLNDLYAAKDEQAPGGGQGNPQLGAAEAPSPDQAAPVASESPSSASAALAPTPAPPGADSPYLGFARTKLKTQLDNDPALKHLLFSRAAAEDSPNPAAQIQETLNRYLARQDEFDRRGGLRAVINDAGFYPATSLRGGNYKKKLPQYESALQQALAGGNNIGYATDNASENVGFGYGKGANDPMTYRSSTGERYGIGNNPRDLAFAARARNFDANMPGQAESIQRALLAPAAQGTVAPEGVPGIAAQEAATALSKGAVKGPPAPRGPFPEPGGQQILHPDLLPKPMYVSPQRAQMLRLNPNVADRGYLLDQYYRQNQPGVMDYHGGKLYYDKTGRIQQFDAAPHDVTNKYGEISIPGRIETKYGPHGFESVNNMPPLQYGGAPTTIPEQAITGAPQAIPPNEASPGSPAADESPPELPAIKSESPAAPPKSMLSATPPDVARQESPAAPYTAKELHGSLPEATPQTQAAPTQQAPTNDLGAALKPFIDLSNQMKTGTANATEEGKALAKTQEAILKNSADAHVLRGNVERMYALNNDENMTTGWGKLTPEVIQGRRLLNKITGGKHPQPTQYDEFEKLRSDTVLKKVRDFVAGGGLGRVLQSEFNTVGTSIANPEASQEANNANLIQTKRLAAKAEAAGAVVKGYMQGYRIGPDGNWLKDANGKYIKAPPGSASNSDMLANLDTWAAAPQNAILSPEERAGSKDMYKGPAKPGEAAEESKKKKSDVVKPNETIQGLFGNAPAATELPAEALSYLKEGKPQAFENGQVWTLRDGKPVRLK